MISSKKSVIKNKLNNELLFCLTVLSIIFIPTLSRSWLYYDENIIYENKYFPVPLSLSEIPEIIKNLGFNFNIVSSNLMYSSNQVIRTSPFGQILWMTINCFFKGNPFYYHLFNFLLHVINTCFVFYIFKFFLRDKKLKFLPLLFSLIWAIHPVMIEPILLSTNIGATFSYMFLLGFILDFLKNRSQNLSLVRIILIPILFLIPMLTNEYIISLPFLLFMISFSQSYKESGFSSSMKNATKETVPYIIGFLIYSFYFFFIAGFKSSQTLNPDIEIILERVFWLSPQIFFHLLKLVFYPYTLSIDQTIFVKLGDSRLDPYSIFCLMFLLCFLTIPLIYFLKQKEEWALFLSWGFFISLFPFLHILFPSYTLSAERYLYIPLLFILLGIALLIKNKTKNKIKSFVFILLILALSICFTRSKLRTSEWSDNYSFINSTYKNTNNNFFKAVKLGMLGKMIPVFEPLKTQESKKYFIEAIDFLESAKKDFENKKASSKEIKILTSYGIDPDSFLLKIAFLLASSKCIELNEPVTVGLEILSPFKDKIEKASPSIVELYSYFLIKEKRYGEARSILEKSLDQYPNDPLILNKLIEIHSEHLRDLTKAEYYLKKEFEKFPYDPSILKKGVEFYYRNNDLSSASKYSYLLGLRTQSLKYYTQAFSIFMLLKDFNSPLMVSIASKLEKYGNNDPETLYLLSKYFYIKNDPNKSLKVLTKAYEISKSININPDLYVEIIFNLAKLNIISGDKRIAASLTEDLAQLTNSYPKYSPLLDTLYKMLEN